MKPTGPWCQIPAPPFSLSTPKACHLLQACFFCNIQRTSVVSSCRGSWWGLNEFKHDENGCLEWRKPSVMAEKVKNVKLLVAQSCPTLCNCMHCIPGSSVHGILQARILEWVAIPFSRRSSWPRDRTRVSCIAGGFFTIWATREGYYCYCWFYYFLKSLITYLFLAAVGLCRCAWAVFVASGGYFSWQFEGFSSRSRLSLWSAGSRARRRHWLQLSGSRAQAQSLWCSGLVAQACGIFPDQASSPWQAASPHCNTREVGY